MLFDKCICFTDIHIGLRHNSPVHNDDCIEFIEWLIATAKKRGIKTCVFLGDFMHQRNSINSHTLDYGLHIAQRLNDEFENTYFLVGNHDMYLKDDRSITSTKFASLFPNIAFIDSIEERDGVAFIPWLVGDEWKRIQSMKAKYLFGHLELPGFMMNASVMMPDHGELDSKHFPNQDHVFSGHFHARQSKGNIHYIGNPFGHNYSDAGDFKRGATVLEWGNDPEFLDYESGPRFMSIPLATMLANPDAILRGKVYLQVSVDASITYEEAAYLKEIFIKHYPNVREFKLIHSRAKVSSGTVEIDNFKTVDQIVVAGLTNIDSGTFDNNTLINIYNQL